MCNDGITQFYLPPTHEPTAGISQLIPLLLTVSLSWQGAAGWRHVVRSESVRGCSTLVVVLPPEIRANDSLQSFKSQLKTYYF